MSFSKNLRHIWFRSLGLRELGWLAICRLAGPVRIFADSVTPRAGKLAAFLNIEVEIVLQSMAIEDPEGRNIRARAEELNAQLRHGLLKDGGDFSWLPADQRAHGPEWQRLLASHCFEQSTPVGSFVSFVENHYRLDQITGEAPTEIILHVGPHVLARELKRLPVKTRLSIPLRLQAHGDGLLPLLCQHLLQQGWRLSYALRRQLRPCPPEVHIPDQRQGIVLVQYERGILERLPVGAIADWIEFSGISPGRIVFYFTRSDSPLDEQTRQELSARGYGWADYYQPDNYLETPLATTLKCLLQSLALLPGLRSHFDIWRWQVVSAALQRVAAHRSFIRQHKVWAIHQGLEFMPFTMMQILAARQEDAMFVWGFWSVLVFTITWYDHAMVDLLLSWGDYDQGHSNTLSLDYRYAVQTGLLGYDGAEPDDQEKAAEIRARLWAKPRFVVTLFDSSHTLRSIHHSTDRCALFYRIVLTLVRDNPDWGCLIKSKNLDLRDLTGHDDLQVLLELLQSQGRALVLPRTVKPSLATWAGDAAVTFSVNSAGFQAALGTDRPALHFDPNQLTFHPISVAGGDGKIIFRDDESFAKALMSIAQGERIYGDLTPWKHLLDPFLDGMGRKRSGKVMGDYIAARDRGLPMAEALREAMQIHADTYGQDFVTTRMEAHNSAGDKLWQETRKLHYPDWPPGLPYTKAALSTKPILSKEKPSP